MKLWIQPKSFFSTCNFKMLLSLNLIPLGIVLALLSLLMDHLFPGDFNLIVLIPTLIVMVTPCIVLVTVIISTLLLFFLYAVKKDISVIEFCCVILTYKLPILLANVAGVFVLSKYPSMSVNIGIGSLVMFAEIYSANLLYNGLRYYIACGKITSIGIPVFLFLLQATLCLTLSSTIS